LAWKVVLYVMLQQKVKFFKPWLNSKSKPIIKITGADLGNIVHVKSDCLHTGA
jgi:Holliday junction resolvase RusA-like endonuclease